jgi:hypothetical protein
VLGNDREGYPEKQTSHRKPRLPGSSQMMEVHFFELKPQLPSSFILPLGYRFFLTDVPIRVVGGFCASGPGTAGSLTLGLAVRRVQRKYWMERMTVSNLERLGEVCHAFA